MVIRPADFKVLFKSSWLHFRDVTYCCGYEIEGTKKVRRFYAQIVVLDVEYEENAQININHEVDSIRFRTTKELTLD